MGTDFVDYRDFHRNFDIFWDAVEDDSPDLVVVKKSTTPWRGLMLVRNICLVDDEGRTKKLEAGNVILEDPETMNYHLCRPSDVEAYFYKIPAPVTPKMKAENIKPFILSNR